MLNKKIDVGIGKEEVLERTPQSEFGYTGLNEETKNSSQLLDWTGEEDLWATSTRTALAIACVGEITVALSGSSAKSKLIALGNPTYAGLNHQHRTLQ